MQFQITHGDKKECQKRDRKFVTCLTLQTFNHQTHTLSRKPEGKTQLWKCTRGWNDRPDIKMRFQQNSQSCFSIAHASSPVRTVVLILLITFNL